MIKTSIVLVTYNHEKYIQQAIESILMQQGCGAFELLVCDDCSTDNTISIAKNMLSNNTNVQFYLNPKNLGITKNYQYAFSRCKGEYIFVLEGDDYWIDAQKIKRQIDFMDRYPICSVSAHPFITLRTDNGVFEMPANAVKQTEFFDGKDLVLDSSIISNFSTCCYRRSVLEKMAPETYEVISYDWMINMSMSKLGLIGRINEPMSVYRIGASGSWQGVATEKQLQGMIDIIPIYDSILQHTYHHYFEIKKQSLQNELVNLTSTKSSYSKKSFIPPFLINLGKAFIPPAFFIYRANKKIK
jgi:glycosyltransferase involved in cell wall biosynthesis